MQQLRASLKELLEWVKKYGPLIFVVAIAAAMRYSWLRELPAGLFPDEAANGLDVNLILDGKIQPFFERGNGREGLFFYLLTPAVLVLGRTPFAHHLVSASIGILTVLFTYLLIRRWIGPRMAFVAAFLTAVNAWYVTMSRTAFRANLTPLFILLFLYFATRVVQSKSRKDYWWSAIGSGLTFGLGFYTYISYRMMIPLVAGTAVLLFIADMRSPQKWSLLKKYWRAITAFCISFLVSISWLAFYFIKNPDYLGGRAGQVSIFSPDLNNGDLWGTFLLVLKKTLAGFLYIGDFNWRHNVSGFSFLSFIIAPFFVGGLLFIMFQSVIFIYKIVSRKLSELDYKTNLRRLPFFLMAALFVLMLIPELLTAEGIPHGLRLIGVIPVVFIIPALFIEELLTPRKSKFLHFLLAVILTAEFVYGSYLYFGVAGQSPEYQAAFRADLTTVSDYLNKRDSKDKTYLVLDWFSQQSTEYLTTETNQPYHIVDPASLWTGPNQVKIDRYEKERLGLALTSGDQVIFTQSTLHDTDAFENNYPNAVPIKKEINKFGETVMIVYEQP